jgi:soluble lytic murein transglycosylase-like protein
MTRNSQSVRLIARAIVFLSLFALAFLGAEVRAKELYKYRDKEGIEWITDHAMPANAYAYIGKYGRPTAVSSPRSNLPLLEGRVATYRPLITRYASRYGIDPLLITAVIRTESYFNHRAASQVGAQGLMQLMPYTAAELGVSDSFDPEQNIRGGVEYLSKMLRKFGNDSQLALAAYNAGPGAVERYGGVPPFRETKKYLRQVMAHYRRYSANLL